MLLLLIPPQHELSLLGELGLDGLGRSGVGILSAGVLGEITTALVEARGHSEPTLPRVR